MNAPANPRMASELCEWLEANRPLLLDALRQAPVTDIHSARAAWDRLALKLQSGSVSEHSPDAEFLGFLRALVAIPCFKELLPGGFQDFLDHDVLSIGRAPRAQDVDDMARSYARFPQVVNELIRDADESLVGRDLPDGKADADNPSSPSGAAEARR